MMNDEVDPMRDLGLTQDREFVCEPLGFLTPADLSRDLFERFIPRGGHIYDLIEGYDLLTTLVLNSGGTETGALRYMAPFLKAFGATDYTVSKFYRDTVPLNGNAAETMNYLMTIMPVFMNTSAYEHAADAVCEKTGVPEMVTGSTELCLDDCHMSVDEMREIRRLAREISKIPIPEPNVSHDFELNRGEVKLVSALDEIFHTRFQNNAAADIMHNTATVGVSEKSYNLLDIRKNMQIDLDGVMYVGGENNDCQVLNLVSESGGLAVTFNGAEAAVNTADVAVIGDDCTVIAFLGSIFFDTGPQGVKDLVADWYRKTLGETDAPDPNLRDRLLKMYPDSLPEVYLMDGTKDAQIAERSSEYRRKMTEKTKLRRAKLAGDSLSRIASERKI